MYDNKEKQIIVSLISSALIMGFYSFYVYNHYISGNESILNDFKFWGKAFLILIPVSVIAQIIIHIIFAIINKIITSKDVSTISDERDKLIELKSVRISHWVFLFVFLAAMSSQALGFEPYYMFLMLIAAGFAASIIEGIAQLYYYRKGF